MKMKIIVWMMVAIAIVLVAVPVCISATEPHLYEPIYINQKADESFDVKYQYDKTNGMWLTTYDKGAIGTGAGIGTKDTFADGQKKIYDTYTESGGLAAFNGNVKDDMTIGEGDGAKTYKTGFWKYGEPLNEKQFMDEVKAEDTSASDIGIPVSQNSNDIASPPAEETKIPTKTRQFTKPPQDPSEVIQPESSPASSPSGDYDPDAFYSFDDGKFEKRTEEEYAAAVRLRSTITKKDDTGTLPQEDSTEVVKTDDSDYYGQGADGTWRTGSKNDLELAKYKDVGKVKEGKTYVQGGVLITTTGENSPSTLNYGGESVTLPAKSEVDFNNMDKDTFTVLHTLDEQTWGGLGDLKVERDFYYSLGDWVGFAGGDGTVILQDIVGDNRWSEMIIVDNEGYTTTYECDSPDNCAGFRTTTIILGDYTSEKRAPDGVTVTQINTHVGGDLTTTNFQMMAFENPDNPDKPLRHNVILVGDDAYYSEVTLFGLQWFKFSKSDCSPPPCPDGEKVADKDLPEGAEAAGKQAIYGGGWNLFGEVLEIWQQGTAGYSGMSLLYDEPDPIIELDETMSALLGGIDGWTSLICKDEMVDSLDSGMAFSSNPSGAYAHVEGEKIIMGHYNESLPAKSQYYKISASVDPGGEDTGCDIKFSLYLKGSGGTLYLYEDNGSVAYSSSEKTYELVRGEGGISYAGSAMEFFEDERDFDKICIKFHDLYPEFVSAGEGCLVGVNEGDEICNNLNNLGEAGSFEDPCHNSFGFIMPHCWG